MAQENGGTLSGDLVINLKKSVRNPSLRIQAYEAAVTGQVSPLANFIIPNGRTIVLCGAVLMLDVLLLAFLLKKEGNWQIDFKWILILAIIDFMLVFQLLPIAYLLVKSFLPDGTFSLETFRRLYSYSMNWNALKNAHLRVATMVLVGYRHPPGLAGAGPICRQKVFGSLFVLTIWCPYLAPWPG